MAASGQSAGTRAPADRGRAPVARPPHPASLPPPSSSARPRPVAQPRWERAGAGWLRGPGRWPQGLSGRRLGAGEGPGRGRASALSGLAFQSLIHCRAFQKFFSWGVGDAGRRRGRRGQRSGAFSPRAFRAACGVPGPGPPGGVCGGACPGGAGSGAAGDPIPSRGGGRGHFAGSGLCGGARAARAPVRPWPQPGLQAPRRPRAGRRRRGRRSEGGARPPRAADAAVRLLVLWLNPKATWRSPRARGARATPRGDGGSGSGPRQPGVPKCGSFQNALVMVSPARAQPPALRRARSIPSPSAARPGAAAPTSAAASPELGGGVLPAGAPGLRGSGAPSPGRAPPPRARLGLASAGRRGGAARPVPASRKHKGEPLQPREGRGCTGGRLQFSPQLRKKSGGLRGPRSARRGWTMTAAAGRPARVPRTASGSRFLGRTEISLLEKRNPTKQKRSAHDSPEAAGQPCTPAGAAQGPRRL